MEQEHVLLTLQWVGQHEYGKLHVRQQMVVAMLKK